MTAFTVIVLSAFLAALIAFGLARTSKLNVINLLQTKLTNKTLVNKLIVEIDKDAHRHGMRAVLILRFARTPYIALSYAAGFVPSLSLSSYLWATLVTNIISAIVLVLIGATFITYISLIALVIVIGWVIYVTLGSKPKAS